MTNRLDVTDVIVYRNLGRKITQDYVMSLVSWKVALNSSLNYVSDPRSVLAVLLHEV
jgi:hypothetical protein